MGSGFRKVHQTKDSFLQHESLGELCWVITNDVAFLRKLDFESDWKASSHTFSMTVYFRESLIYKPTPPEARGVGTYSKTYPGILVLKSISLPLIILVSETPIILNSKLNSSNRWTWKFSRFRLKLLILLCKREKLESLTRLGSSLLNWGEVIEDSDSVKNTINRQTDIWWVDFSGTLSSFHDTCFCEVSYKFAHDGFRSAIMLPGGGAMSNVNVRQKHFCRQLLE